MTRYGPFCSVNIAQDSAAIVREGKGMHFVIGCKLILYNAVLCPDPYLIT